MCAFATFRFDFVYCHCLICTHTHTLSLSLTLSQRCAQFLHFIVVNVVIFTNEHMDWGGDVKINNTKNYPENTLPVALKRSLRGYAFNSFEWYSYQLNDFLFSLFGYTFNQPLFDFITHWITPTGIECRFSLNFSFDSSHFLWQSTFQLFDSIPDMIFHLLEIWICVATTKCFKKMRKFLQLKSNMNYGEFFVIKRNQKTKN